MRKLFQSQTGFLILIGVGIILAASFLGFTIANNSSSSPAPTAPPPSPTVPTPTITLVPATPTPSGPLVIPLVTVETPVISTLTPIPTAVTYFDGPIIIGYSVDERPLEVYRFGTGERAFMVVGGTHGGYEVNTVNLTFELIEYYKTHPEAIPNNTRLYILKALNVDGLQIPYDKEGRANANQVDLNRNYPIEWVQDWDKTGCWDYGYLYGGEGPASEPETQALMSFITENPLIALVSYHAAAPGLYPAGPNHEPSVTLSKYLSEASGYPFPGITLGCYMTGSMADWVASTGAASIDIELSNHYETEFETNLKLVNALLNWRP